MQWKVVPWRAEKGRESARKLLGGVSGLVCFPWREDQTEKHQRFLLLATGWSVIGHRCLVFLFGACNSGNTSPPSLIQAKPRDVL